MAGGTGSGVKKRRLKKRGWTDPNAALELRDAGLKCARSVFKCQREVSLSKGSIADAPSKGQHNILRLKKLGLIKFLQDAWQWQQGDYCEDFARNYDPAMKRTEVRGGIVVDLSLEGFVRLTGLSEGDVVAPIDAHLKNFSSEAGVKVSWGRVLYTVFINEVNRMHSLLSMNKKTTTCAGPLMCYLTARSACEQQIALAIPPPAAFDESEPESDRGAGPRRRRRKRRKRRASEHYTSDEDEGEDGDGDEDEDEDEEGGVEEDHCGSDGDAGRKKASTESAQPRTPLRPPWHRSALHPKAARASPPAPAPAPARATPPGRSGRSADKVSTPPADVSRVKLFRSAMTEKRADLHKKLNDLLKDSLEQDDVYTEMLGEWEVTLKELEAWRAVGLASGAANPADLQASLSQPACRAQVEELRRFQQLGQELLCAGDFGEMAAALRHRLNCEEQATKLYKEEQQYAAQCLKAQLHAESVAEAATLEIKALRAEVQELKARGYGNAVTEQFPKEQIDKLRARLEEAILQKEVLVAERDKLLEDLRVPRPLSMVSHPRAFVVSPTLLLPSNFRVKEEYIQTRHSA
ncbi:hypothetical protein MPTK1_1g20350 [Marchantia polymorpha subsp. ruderalis]|uniref:Uncharacterized protein n=4 Tax=Marchantia polymorpha TaxID=3197 RepID=A0AAF6AS90_MARPO|nr:hypothetical protein MARPO_0001s0372 [Marchantia polymorpha]BBM99310.1 hypothetical protein Mp_1g20350 [Marchantia polymorpha subsp. ruderalis]|eukprot:PTQ50393.1 hypothetical protein MARPO_0001s0372 [Marchantia polymorpha]